MVKMVSFKKSAADRSAEKDALSEARGGLAEVPAENEGVAVNFEHHHLEKLGVGGGLKSGHKVQLHAAGTVERSETRSGPDGDQHSATIRLHKGYLEHEVPGGGDEERRSVRGDLEKAYAGVRDKELPDKKSPGPAK
jgi:hypothetical protein